MIKECIAHLAADYLYNLPKHPDPGLLTESYTESEKLLVLGMCRSVLDPNAPSVQSLVFLDAISRVMFHVEIDANSIASVDIKTTLKTLSPGKQFDAEILIVLITLSHPDRLKERIKRVMPHLEVFQHKALLVPIFEDILNNETGNIQNNRILGHSYQNNQGKVNAIRELGLFEYERQLHAMEEGFALNDVAKQFAFLKKLPANTVGAKMMEYFEQYHLTLFGGKGALPSYYLWHELSHALSENAPHFKGEILTNAFTAGYVDRGKMQVLIFGLFNWALGIKTSVIAMPEKNKLCQPGLIDEYLANLLRGERCTLNLFDLTLEEQIAQLSEDLKAVQTRYNITDCKAA